jgi:hypothetical protein
MDGSKLCHQKCEESEPVAKSTDALGWGYIEELTQSTHADPSRPSTDRVAQRLETLPFVFTPTQHQMWVDTKGYRHIYVLAHTTSII